MRGVWIGVRVGWLVGWMVVVVGGHGGVRPVGWGVLGVGRGHGGGAS